MTETQTAPPVTDDDVRPPCVGSSVGNCKRPARWAVWMDRGKAWARYPRRHTLDRRLFDWWCDRFGQPFFVCQGHRDLWAEWDIIEREEPL